MEIKTSIFEGTYDFEMKLDEYNLKVIVFTS